jgi:hypothetical protein
LTWISYLWVGSKKKKILSDCSTFLLKNMEKAHMLSSLSLQANLQIMYCSGKHRAWKESKDKLQKIDNLRHKIKFWAIRWLTWRRKEMEFQIHWTKSLRCTSQYWLKCKRKTMNASKISKGNSKKKCRSSYQIKRNKQNTSSRKRKSSKKLSNRWSEK